MGGKPLTEHEGILRLRLKFPLAIQGQRRGCIIRISREALLLSIVLDEHKTLINAPDALNLVPVHGFNAQVAIDHTQACVGFHQDKRRTYRSEFQFKTSPIFNDLRGRNQLFDAS